MTSLIAALLLFDGIIMFHEFGHFLLARRAGIAVIEFSIGMGPRLITFVHGGTRYSLKLLPLGGSCAMLGESLTEDDLKYLRAPKVLAGTSYEKAGIVQRFLTIFAGPAFNFLLAFLGACFLVCVAGSDPARIGKVAPESPAMTAGLQEGDEIISLNGFRTYLFRDLMVYGSFHEGEPLRVVYERDGKRETCEITPEYSEEKKAYQIGISGGGYERAENPGAVIRYAYAESRYWAYVTVQSLEKLITRKVSADNIGGPVRIVGMIGNTVEKSKPYGALTVAVNLAAMTVLLSVNLGIMNLLPVPALDGGKLILILLELIRGKRLSKQTEYRINLFGFALLMALMMFAVFNDFRMFFRS